MDFIYAAMVHDVKNQLAELALRLDARGDAQTELAITIRASQRLTKLLLLQRHESGQLCARIDSASPSELIQDLANEYRALFPALEISTQTDDAPPFWFYDAQLTRLALGNALHNACRHARRNVTLRVSTSDDQLVFTIQNDGAPFPPELIDSEQLTPAQISARGTGLGLFLAQKIAALHTLKGRSGSVQLSNTDGAKFCLTLP